MKALTIINESVTREALLEMVEKIPGAWIGIRIAALLLLLADVSAQNHKGMLDFLFKFNVLFFFLAVSS